MKNVFFGLALAYDEGRYPGIALNDENLVLEVHEANQGDDLLYRIGRLNQMAISLDASISFAQGTQPAIAMRGHDFIAVYASASGNGLFYRVGRIDDDGIHFGDGVRYASGDSPCVAMNDNAVIEIHKSPTANTLWYNLGRLDRASGNMLWSRDVYLDEGVWPAVAINGKGQIVMAYRATAVDEDGEDINIDPEVHLRIGRLQNQDNRIQWSPAIVCGNGSQPAIALTDDGDVILVFAGTDRKSLLQRFGRLRPGGIDWSDEATHFDEGMMPCVACSGAMAVQAHRSENTLALWNSSSRIVNRSDWMSDSLRWLGAKTLSTLTTGASHDAGMYEHGPRMSLGKTQDLNLYLQLSNGIRYFDLRPKWTGSALHVTHGPITGPSLTDILGDVKKFMREGHRELVVLKFSHYSGFDASVYRKLIELIQAELDPWLYRAARGARRLADIPLAEYLKDIGVVLVVCDEDYPVEQPCGGIWIYRDYDSPTALLGDLRVYDKYSNSMVYETMKKDQLGKFAKYDGLCTQVDGGQRVRCDQFLLSWTLTPPTGVWLLSKEANRHLGQAMADESMPNSFDKVINLLYVDYVEYSRATDVAMSMNGIP